MKIGATKYNNYGKTNDEKGIYTIMNHIIVQAQVLKLIAYMLEIRI